MFVCLLFKITCGYDREVPPASLPSACLSEKSFSRELFEETRAGEWGWDNVRYGYVYNVYCLKTCTILRVHVFIFVYEYKKVFSIISVYPYLKLSPSRIVQVLRQYTLNTYTYLMLSHRSGSHTKYPQ